MRDCLLALGGALIAIMAAMALIGGASPVGAQEMHDLHDPGHWYDPECCSLRDCAPVPWGAVQETREGYMVSLGPGDHFLVDGQFEEHIAHGDRRIRESRDGDWHVCLSHGSTPMVLCVYRPPSLF